MKVITEHRASVILYNILKSNSFKGKFLLPANICPIVPATFFKAKIPFEFVDIDPDTLCMGKAAVLDKLKTDKSIVGILYVRTYGSDHNAETLFECIKNFKESLYIIDDQCLKRPEFISGEMGTRANLILNSTGYAKYVDLGYGGFAYLDDKANYERYNLTFNPEDHKKLQQQFKKSIETENFKYADTNWLGNTRIKLKTEEYFDTIKDIRRKVDSHKSKINDIYLIEIPEQFQLNPSLHDWRFNITVNNKNEVLNKIFQEDLFASSHYASLINIFGRGKGGEAKRLHNKIINLFNDFRFSVDDAYKVALIIKDYAK